ncbi:MAG TPA: hypothetical protein VE078_02425 [Thermoanaerobaculia bacterium]|nr:hypothetical protein [Thermoanaerobaculia bacterium]
MPSWIDGALYPDTEVPEELRTLADRVDFLVRLCSAWDFGLLPDREAIEEIRRPGWSEAVEAARLLTSPAYHLVRTWHGLPTLPYLGQQIAMIRDDPNLAYV